MASMNGERSTAARQGFTVRKRVARGKLRQLSVNDECPEGGSGNPRTLHVCTTRWGVSRDQMTITTAERRLDNDVCSTSARRREITVF